MQKSIWQTNFQYHPDFSHPPQKGQRRARYREQSQNEGTYLFSKQPKNRRWSGTMTDESEREHG